MTDKDNRNKINQLIEKLLNEKKFNDATFEIMKTIIYTHPINFYSISSDNFTKEEYNELKELAGFLQI